MCDHGDSLSDSRFSFKLGLGLLGCFFVSVLSVCGDTRDKSGATKCDGGGGRWEINVKWATHRSPIENVSNRFREDQRYTPIFHELQPNATMPMGLQSQAS